MRIVRALPGRPRAKVLLASLFAIAFMGSLLGPLVLTRPAQAQVNSYCQLSNEEITQKEALRQQAFQGDAQAKSRYQEILQRHGDLMSQCRSRTWPQRQAIWVRLYPCDAQPGIMEALLDRMINRGYSHVYVEVFYNGQVLLPTAQNSTAWPSVIRTPGQENHDLLAEIIEKGHERGLKVYAWMFSMNFGYSYSQRSDRQQALARNGQGQNTLTASYKAGSGAEIGGVNSEEAFIDPYSLQAKQDYYQMVQQVIQRRPDGMLFDYIRYPRGEGAASVASQVTDLWIYGPSSYQALLQRALNNKGMELIRRFVSRGYITAGDVEAVDQLYPGEGEPMWQGRVPPAVSSELTPGQRQPQLQLDLWHLSVAHALQGVLDFLATAAYPAQQQQIPTGAVFFPNGNQVVGRQGFDSRLQPWDQFPASMEWHPMVYGICGNTTCITDEVRRVLSKAAAGTQVHPVLAGTWGQPMNSRPSLEMQMQAIRQIAPQINSVSHFAYSWQDPEFDRVRKFCQP